MNINISSQHYEAGDELGRYIEKKLARLGRYVPRHARKTVHADVHLSQEQGKPTDSFECEVVLHLPHAEIVAKEATINMFAAIDIVEAKLKNQLLRYKEKSEDHKPPRVRFWRRLRSTRGL